MKEDAFVRQRILLLLVSALALLVPAVAASANSSQFTTVEAPRELTTTDVSPDPTLDEIQSLGADGIRIQLGWRFLAPSPESRTKPSFNATDPAAYSGWEKYDRAIDGARERGLLVHLTITGAAPTWGTAGKDPEGLNRPDPAEFGKFATAVGRRYGARVAYWSVWNEPNLGKLLKPIYDGSSNRLLSPITYRNLYVRAYSGLRAANVRKPILVGELAPQRNSSRTFGTVAPIDFLRGMLCLDKNYKPVKVNGQRCSKLPTQGFAMHPYSTQAGPFLRPADQGNVVIGVLDRLTRALDRAAAAGAIASRLPLYLTEFGVQSKPDGLIGVPLDKQSDFRSIAERIAFLNPRVKSFSQYLMRDDDNPTGRAYGSFESGLYLYKGNKPKPALYGFRLPLVVVPRSATSATLWGLVRPAKGAGSVTVQYRDSGAWKTLGRQRFDGKGYWTRTVSTTAKRSWRVSWTAPDGETYAGPATRAHTKP
ncbi:hypothetical protein VSS74_18660 [Conexibacter stalactiti]|uniref:Glycoside hydrolase family 5 domain-containing protein n=1 Tax=Conexibacter stalactiti TaxID=1940611 RepID=A0ABU4HV03_9ACTN|nr:hypothetical protein [Conexibacter stalactiti]MDW5596375.1 hypothetical protein [Conexibacter stalactiti]MEC5037017.1 hypothetical protein [Conexibacter stalactiti]